MTLNPSLLRSSFELVVERAPDLTIRFYEILFERYPQLAPLFAHGNRGYQARMLAEALAAVIDHLDDSPWLTQVLSGLGKRHVGYGVTTEMYAMVGDALITTLAETAGDDWTAELEAQWMEAFGAIRDLMLAGAAEASEAA